MKICFNLLETSKIHVRSCSLRLNGVEIGSRNAFGTLNFSSDDINSIYKVV